MYSVISFNSEKETIEFKILQTGQQIEFKLSDNFENKYRAVNKQHYIDLQNNEIVNINDPVLTNRLFIKDDDKLYKKASQCDFDFWMNSNYPESDNGKVYTLISNILENINDYTDSEDEDPYYRGSIDEFMLGIKK